MLYRLLITFLSLILTGPLSNAGPALTLNSTEPGQRIMQMADSLFPEYKGNFRLVTTKESPLGHHYTLVQQYRGTDIFGTYLKLHISYAGKLYHHQSHIFKVNSRTGSSLGPDAVWVIRDNDLSAMRRVSYTDRKGNPWLILLNNTDTFQKFPLFLAYKDSAIKAKVFMPNPITSSHGIYAGAYTDQNDANSPALEAELKEVSLNARFDNGEFILQNEYLTITEISHPDHPVTPSSSPLLYYNRSQYQFEDINAFYHLSVQIERLQKLGFQKLLPNIRVDTHGLGGADQSLFKYIDNPNTIEYGTGGVDDAEDAEVVVHEYGHALSQSASPGTTIDATMERLSMEEGWADYLAVSHFKAYDPYNWDKVFDWDGHNEFWAGMSTNSAKHYPEDMKNRRDADREIWSTPLLCLADKLGKPLADSLIFQHLYFQATDATMPQMAEKIIYIDTLFFYGDHYRAIKECFIASGILHKDHRDLFPGDLSEDTKYRFVNTSGFAANDGPLGIKFNHKVDCALSVYDLTGRLILQQTHNRADIIFLEPELFGSGLYLINIQPLPNARGFSNFYINEKILKN